LREEGGELRDTGHQYSGWLNLKVVEDADSDATRTLADELALLAF
jgi:hypothetical protein